MFETPGGFEGNCRHEEIVEEPAAVGRDTCSPPGEFPLWRNSQTFQETQAHEDVLQVRFVELT